MAEFTLPANSKIDKAAGKTSPGAGRREAACARS